jgi:hypothetical protein
MEAEGSPEPVRVHDFLIPDQGKAIPYGAHDRSRDTVSFAIHAVRRWGNSWEGTHASAPRSALSRIASRSGLRELREVEHADPSPAQLSSSPPSAQCREGFPGPAGSKQEIARRNSGRHLH